MTQRAPRDAFAPPGQNDCGGECSRGQPGWNRDERTPCRPSNSASKRTGRSRSSSAATAHSWCGASNRAARDSVELDGWFPRSEHHRAMSTLVLDPKRYAVLLAKTLPRVLESEEQHARMLGDVERLMKKGDNRTPEEDALLDLMVVLVENFEGKHDAIPKTDPR